jgi:hypothetical protein
MKNSVTPWQLRGIPWLSSLKKEIKKRLQTITTYFVISGKFGKIAFCLYLN